MPRSSPASRRKSAGPGTRANIDEFTETTARAIEKVGGAARGKAIIVLNPAEPPLIMRNTVFCLVDDADREADRASCETMVADVQAYVPGYRLKQEVQFERIGGNDPLRIPGVASSCHGPQGLRVPRGRRRRPLPAGLRRQSRHHDLGGAARPANDRADATEEPA